MIEIFVSVIVVVFILIYIKNFIEKKFDEQFEVLKTISEALVDRLDSNSEYVKGSYKEFRSDYLSHTKKLDIYIGSNKKLITLINEMNNNSIVKKEKKKIVKENSDKVFSKLEDDIKKLAKS